jgi:hypothetical protein
VTTRESAAAGLETLYLGNGNLLKIKCSQEETAAPMEVKVKTQTEREVEARLE